MSANFLQNFAVYKESPAFLNLNGARLGKLLSSNEITLGEVEIFESAYRWAMHQCSLKGVQSTPEKLREILGNSLFQIRFPLMSLLEFSKVVCPTKILSARETSAIFQYLAMEDSDRCGYEVSLLGFKVNPRKLNIDPLKFIAPQNTEICKLSLFEDSESSAEFNENVASVFFYSDTRIQLMGVGFPAPLSMEKQYEVHVEPLIEVYGKWITCGSFEELTHTKAGRICYIHFDQPIVCDASDFSATPYNVCIRFSYNKIKYKIPIEHSLNKSEKLHQNENDFPLEMNKSAIYLTKTEAGVTFNLRFKKEQTMEILFRKLE